MIRAGPVRAQVSALSGILATDPKQLVEPQQKASPEGELTDR
jgi:hypothetical protein